MTRLIRTLQVGSRGTDVDGCKRTVYRGLDSLDGGKRLKKHNGQPATVRRLFGSFFRADVLRLEKLTAGLQHDGKVTPQQFEIWEAKDYPDSLAKSLIDDYETSHARLLCYPHPNVPGVYVGQRLHETGGIPGNWACDFMAPGGTEVFASCAAKVTRFAGHDPSTGTWKNGHPDSSGDVFGWSMYLEDEQGRTYFLTHLGSRSVNVGSVVGVGQKIGEVGNWPGDPGRSHTHEGVSSPKGYREAQARILAIADAERLPPL